MEMGWRPVRKPAAAPMKAWVKAVTRKAERKYKGRGDWPGGAAYS